MQAHRYFLLVNDQQLDQVIIFEAQAITDFINEYVQVGQDNQLTFYRVVKWLKQDSNIVLKQEKDIIWESSVKDKITSDHEIVTKILERKEGIKNLQAAIFDVEKYLNQ
jgi:hypothetical protein